MYAGRLGAKWREPHSSWVFGPWVFGPWVFGKSESTHIVILAPKAFAYITFRMQKSLLNLPIIKLIMC